MGEPVLLFVKDRRRRLPAVVILENSDTEAARLAATHRLQQSPFIDWVTVVDFAQRAVKVMRDSTMDGA